MYLVGSQRSKIIFLVLFLNGCVTSSWFESKQSKRLEVFASDEMRVALKFAKIHGSIEEAIEEISIGLQKNPKNLRRRLVLARLFLVSGKLSDAERHAKIVERYQYRNLQAKIILANVAFMKGFDEKSKLILGSLGRLKKVSKSAKTEILNLLAGVALRQGEDQVSINYLKQAIRVNSKYLSSHMNIGLVYLKHQEYRLAQRHFQAILRLLPGNDIAQLHLGICYAGQGKYQDAEDLYQRVLKSNPELPTLYFNLAVLEFRRKRFEKSISYLREYVDTADSKYLARKASKEIIDEIQLANVSKSGISDEDIADLTERLKDHEQHSSASEPLSFDRASELNIGFVFTSVGYVND